jgi:hypothetical protein
MAVRRFFMKGRIVMKKSPYLRISLLAVAALGHASAQTTVLGVTPTQAVLQYQAAAGVVCQIQVSPNRSMSPLAADVDPALFSGANLDSRPGSVSSGNGSRTFVVGQRRADVAADGKRYSRALQAFTQYFYNVNCGGSIQTGTFTTLNPPLGNNFPEQPPFEASAFGNYAWPTIDWNDPNKTYIDPMTGILLKRVTSPGWYGFSQTGKNFAFALDLNKAWTNAPGILGGNTGPHANYSGSGGDPIFVAFDVSQLQGVGGGLLSGWQPNASLDNVLVRVFGTGSGTISGCLSDDSGAHCASPAVRIATLPASGGTPAGTFPPACAGDASANCFPNNGFWGGWNFTPAGWQMTGQQGQVNAAGSALTASQYTEFNVNWKPGGKVFVNGSAPGCPENLCTIAAVNSSSSMTIRENAGTLTNAGFKTANSGIVLWLNRGSGTTTASISVNMDYAYSDQFHMPLNGTTAQCSSSPTTVSFAADGATPIPPVQGELCLAAHQNGPEQVLYLLIPSTGETRLLAPIWFFNSNDAAADQVCCGIHMLPAGFDTTDPNTFYAQVNTNGGLSVFRGVYNAARYKYKAYAHSLYPSATGNYSPGEDTSQYWYRGPAWQDSGITWTNMTKGSQGKDLGSQIAAKDPNFDKALFLGPAVTQVVNGKAFTSSGAVTYGETLNLIHAFDLSTGNLVQSADTWSKWPARWCAMHTNEALAGWYGLVCNVLGGAYTFGPTPNIVGVGPWQMTPTAMLKNGTFSSDTSMTTAAPRDACPAIPAFLASIVAPNSSCVTFQSQMACSHTPHAGENTKWPCEYNPSWSELQPMAAGDGLLVINGHGNVETLLILSVTSIGNAKYQFVAVRGMGRGYQNVASGWAGYAVPPTTNCDPTIPCTPGLGMWFDSSAPSVEWKLDPTAFAGHSDMGNGPTPGAQTFCQGGACRFNIPFGQQIGKPISSGNNFIYGSFAGIGGSIALQGYPSLHQLTAPPKEQQWMLNFSHLNPSYGAGPEVPVDVGGVTYNLVAGTKNVFRFTAVSGGLNYKAVPPMAYAGYHLLQDVSGPAKGDIITDSASWKFCVVQNAGECHTGSAAGEVYLSVPSGGVRGSQNCVSNWYDDNFPCVFTPPVQTASGIQQDISRPDPAGTHWRRITMGLSGPGRQYQFGTFIPDPTGTWAFMQGFWMDGARNDLIMAKLPPWPDPQQIEADAKVDRTNFIMRQVQIPADQNLPTARVRFGYAEDGAPGNFFCTPRQEACVTGGKPYSFLSENPAWQACVAGCTIPVPAIPGRVLYYVVDRQDGNGKTITGDTQVAVMP